MRLFPKRFFVQIDCLRFAQTVLGELTQSPYHAFGMVGRFALFTYESKLSTLTMQNAPPTSLEGRL